MREIKFRHWLPEYDEETNTYKDNYKMYYEAFKHNSSKKNTMQYTGLKDKNGKEIYEGDIVTAEDLGNYIISWSSRVLTYCLYKDSFYLFDANKDYKLEVIGNVYENPELLEK